MQEKYLAILDGQTLGDSVGTAQAAAERLIHAIADRLPRKGEQWGLTLSCAGEGLAVAFGNQAGGGGDGGGLHPCAERQLKGRKFESLEEVLRATAQIIGRCCG